jgi:hypothetical protein
MQFKAGDANRRQLLLLRAQTRFEFDQRHFGQKPPNMPASLVASFEMCAGT